MRILVTPDLHGQIPKIYSNFDRIVCVGDYSTSNETVTIFDLIKKNNAENTNLSLKDYVGEKKYNQIQKDKDEGAFKLLSFLAKLSREKVLVIPGNHENSREKVNFANLKNPFEPLRLSHHELLRKVGNCRDFHKKIVRFSEFTLIGYGLSSGPEIPLNYRKFTVKQKTRIKNQYKKLHNEMKELFRKAIKLKKPIIFVSHNIPKDTKLDIVLHKHSPAYGKHYGSIMARKLIDQYQPLICLGGHMHEHFGFDKINKTLIVNVGFGPTKNTYLDIQKNRIMVELWQDKQILKKKTIKL